MVPTRQAIAFQLNVRRFRHWSDALAEILLTFFDGGSAGLAERLLARLRGSQNLCVFVLVHCSVARVLRARRILTVLQGIQVSGSGLERQLLGVSIAGQRTK